MLKWLVPLLFVVACSSKRPSELQAPVDFANTRAAVERFVAAGRTPAAFAQLTRDVESARISDETDRATDAEVRLLAAALPLAESVRSLPLHQQRDALALTVWPALLGIAVHEHENAAGFVARICESQLVRCDDGTELLAIRAAAMQRGNIRMRAALDACLACDSSWQPLAWKWESLDRAAARDLLEHAQQAQSQVATLQ